MNDTERFLIGKKVCLPAPIGWVTVTDADTRTATFIYNKQIPNITRSYGYAHVSYTIRPCIAYMEDIISVEAE